MSRRSPGNQGGGRNISQRWGLGPKVRLWGKSKVNTKNVSQIVSQAPPQPGQSKILNPKFSPARWLQSAMSVAVTHWVEDSPEKYMWRRLQVNEQQAQRQRKNILQKALLFRKRADQLMAEKGAGARPRHEEYEQFFKQGIAEHNRYGVAEANDSYRIAPDLAESLYSFKVPWAYDLVSSCVLPSRTRLSVFHAPPLSHEFINFTTLTCAWCTAIIFHELKTLVADRLGFAMNVGPVTGWGDKRPLDDSAGSQCHESTTVLAAFLSWYFCW